MRRSRPHRPARPAQQRSRSWRCSFGRQPRRSARWRSFAELSELATRHAPKVARTSLRCATCLQYVLALRVRLSSTPPAEPLPARCEPDVAPQTSRTGLRESPERACARQRTALTVSLTVPSLTAGLRGPSSTTRVSGTERCAPSFARTCSRLHPMRGNSMCRERNRIRRPHCILHLFPRCPHRRSCLPNRRHSLHLLRRAGGGSTTPRWARGGHAGHRRGDGPAAAAQRVSSGGSAPLRLRGG